METDLLLRAGHVGHHRDRALQRPITGQCAGAGQARRRLFALRDRDPERGHQGAPPHHQRVHSDQCVVRRERVHVRQHKIAADHGADGPGAQVSG